MSADMNDDAIQTKVFEIVSEQMGVDKAEIKIETSFINDLNADSLDTGELVMVQQNPELYKYQKQKGL